MKYLILILGIFVTSCKTETKNNVVEIEKFMQYQDIFDTVNNLIENQKLNIVKAIYDKNNDSAMFYIGRYNAYLEINDIIYEKQKQLIIR